MEQEQQWHEENVASGRHPMVDGFGLFAEGVVSDAKAIHPVLVYISLIVLACMAAAFVYMGVGQHTRMTQVQAQQRQLIEMQQAVYGK